MCWFHLFPAVSWLIFSQGVCDAQMKEDLRRLQGTWVPTYWEENGRIVVAEKCSTRVDFKGDSMSSDILAPYGARNLRLSYAEREKRLSMMVTWMERDLYTSWFLRMTNAELVLSTSADFQGDPGVFIVRLVRE